MEEGADEKSQMITDKNTHLPAGRQGWSQMTEQVIAFTSVFISDYLRLLNH
ncbi:MAG: hypothetical protein L0958_00365 [Candidatus Mariimomonas ferrooxydans]